MTRFISDNVVQEHHVYSDKPSRMRGWFRHFAGILTFSKRRRVEGKSEVQDAKYYRQAMRVRRNQERERERSRSRHRNRSRSKGYHRSSSRRSKRHRSSHRHPFLHFRRRTHPPCVLLSSLVFLIRARLSAFSRSAAHYISVCFP